MTIGVERRLGACAAIAAIMAAVGCGSGGTDLVKSQCVKGLVVDTSDSTKHLNAPIVGMVNASSMFNNPTASVPTNPQAQAGYRDADGWFFRTTHGHVLAQILLGKGSARAKVLFDPARHTPNDLGFFATKYGLLTDRHNETTEANVGAPSSLLGFAFPDYLAAIIKAKEVPQLAVEVHGAGLGALDGADQEVGQQEEELGEEAESDALAGDWVPGDEDVDAVSDAEFDATEEGVDEGGVRGLDGDIGAEGVELEDGEELGTHGGASSSSSGEAGK